MHRNFGMKERRKGGNQWMEWNRTNDIFNKASNPHTRSIITILHWLKIFRDHIPHPHWTIVPMWRSARSNNEDNKLTNWQALLPIARTAWVLQHSGISFRPISEIQDWQQLKGLGPHMHYATMPSRACSRRKEPSPAGSWRVFPACEAASQRQQLHSATAETHTFPPCALQLKLSTIC